MSEHSVSLLPELSVFVSEELSVELLFSLEVSVELLVSLEVSLELLEEFSVPFSVFLELLFSVPPEPEESDEPPTPLVVDLSVPMPESELLSPDRELPPSSDPPNDPDRSELVSVLPEDSTSIEMRDSRSTELLLSVEVDCLDRN